MSVFTTSPHKEVLDPSKRVNYTLGMLVGDDDLRQDQRYLMARDDRHQRVLHGWGVAAGLDVDINAGGELEVGPGLAVDGVGRSICVPTTQCADLDAVLGWLNARRDAVVERLDEGDELDLHVLLCHLDCPTDLVPVQSGPCRSLQDSLAPSRVADRFELTFGLDAPVAGDLSPREETEEELDDLFRALDAAAEDGDALAAARAVLQGWVSARTQLRGFDGACLDGVEPGCVPLATIRLRLDGAEPLGFVGRPGADDVDATARPFLLSTQVLEEWLLRLATAEDEPVEIALDDLSDVTAAGATPGAVIVSDGDGWQATVPSLSQLSDVAPDGAADGQVLHLSGGIWVPRDLPEPEDGGPVGAASGDLRGTYPDPEVDGLLGTPLIDTRADAHASVGWNPSTGRWDVQTDVSAPAGAYAIVAAGCFQAMGEEGATMLGPVYNGLEVEHDGDDGMGLTYRAGFLGYQDMFNDEQVRLVVKLTVENRFGSPPVLVEALEPDQESLWIRLFPFGRLRDLQGSEFEQAVVHVEVSAFGRIADHVELLREVNG